MIESWLILKGLWPIAIVVGGYGVRVEVGQVLNKQRIKVLEDARKEDVSGMHSRIKRHEDDTKETLREIRTDIKELLSRNH